MWPIGLAFLLFGLLVLADTTLGLRRGNASASWPTTSGRVLSSQLRKSWSPRGGWSYEPQVTYEYTVDGRPPLHGTTIRFGATDYLVERDARQVVARYPVGATVPIHYDPHNPQRSTLEPGVRQRARVLIGAAAGLASAIAGVAFIVL